MPTEQGAVYLAAPDTPKPATGDRPSYWKPLQAGGAETDFHLDARHPKYLWLNVHSTQNTTEANAELLSGTEGPFAVLIIQNGNHGLYAPSVWKDKKDDPPVGAKPQNLPAYWAQMYSAEPIKRG